MPRPIQDISSLNVVDLLLDAVCMVRADSEVVFASAAFERIFGYPPSEAIGKRMFDLVHPEDLAVTREPGAACDGWPSAAAV